MANGTGVLTDLEGASSGLRSNVFQAGTTLAGALGNLDKTQQAIYSGIGIFNLKSFNQLQSTNERLGSLADTYRYERDLENFQFEKDIKGFEFGLEKQGFLFSNTQAGLRDEFKLASLKYENLLGGLADKAEGLELYKDYLKKAQDFQNADLKSDLAAQRGILSSLGRSQQLLTQRLGLVDPIRDIDLGINMLQFKGAKEGLRVTSFGAQSTAARINASRELLFGGVSGVLGAKDLDRETIEASYKIGQAVRKIQTIDLQRSKIYKVALDKKLGIRLQIEGVKRQIINAKNSIKKIKKAIKKNNLNRDYQIARANLALKGVERDVAFTKDRQKLAGTVYKREVQHSKNLNNLIERQSEFGKDMTEKIYTLSSTYKEQNYDNRRNEISGNYIRGRNLANRVFDYKLNELYNLRERQRDEVEHREELLDRREKQRRAGDAFIDEQKRDLEDQGRDYGVPEGQDLEVLPPE